MAALLERVATALAAPDSFTTEQLDALNQEAGRDHCNRRARILHQLQGYLHQNTPAMSAPSTKYRFKKDFLHAKSIREENGTTKAITAQNLTDEDAEYMLQYGDGHLIEPLPKAEKAADKKEADKDEKKK